MKMKTYIFKDILTGESFTVTCFPYEVNSIERTNTDLSKWVEGRIIKRDEK